MLFQTYAWKTECFAVKHTLTHTQCFCGSFCFNLSESCRENMNIIQRTLCFGPFACHFSLDLYAEMPKVVEVFVGRMSPSYCDDENGWGWRKWMWWDASVCVTATVRRQSSRPAQQDGTCAGHCVSDSWLDAGVWEFWLNPLVTQQQVMQVSAKTLNSWTQKFTKSQMKFAFKAWNWIFITNFWNFTWFYLKPEYL